MDQLPTISGPWGVLLSALSVILATVAVEIRGRWADKRSNTKDSLRGLIDASDIIVDNLREEVTRLVDERQTLERDRAALLAEVQQMKGTIALLRAEVHQLRVELENGHA